MSTYFLTDSTQLASEVFLEGFPEKAPHLPETKIE
jgi:hypothetical protein